MSSHHLRSFDAFAKPIEGTRTRTAAGGVITVLSYAAAGILFLCQLYLYAVGETRHSLTLAESVTTEYLGTPHALPLTAKNKYGRPDKAKAAYALQAELEHRQANRIPLRVHVTFPHIKCADLDFSHDNAARSDGAFTRIHGPNALRTTPPTTLELAKALGVEPGSADARKLRPADGCTVRGSLRVPRVGGTLTVTVSRRAWQTATMFLTFGGGGMGTESTFGGGSPHLHNCTHYIHSLTFGEPFPLSPNPLVDSSHVVDNESGVALNNVMVKLVPTVYRRPLLSGGTRHTYQASVTQHIVQPQTLAAQRSPMLPGLAVTYDFSPLAVHHVERRENILVFLGSLVSIVGGVFVTVGLVTGCLYSSAAAVAKKMD